MPELINGRAVLIFFGIEDAGAVLFTGTGDGALVVSIPAQRLPAGYNCDNPLARVGCGTVSLNEVTATSGSGPGTYPFHAGVVAAFTFTQQIQEVVDTLTGTIFWQFIQNGGTGSPEFIGTIRISSSSGEAEFVNEFPAGSIVAIELGMNFFPRNLTLDQLALIAEGQGGGRDFHGVVAPVPEPSSLLLASSAALMGLGAMARRLGVMT
jgi:hypothetical protein